MSEHDTPDLQVIDEALAIVHAEAHRIETRQHRQERWKTLGRNLLNYYGQGSWAPFGWAMPRLPRTENERDDPPSSW